MMESVPLRISVITINRNQAEYLELTMNSVHSQTYQPLEYIIIDGGSTDGSLDVIRESESRLAYWCSEPDRGIAHAFNKGLEKATGDYILILNSGDRFLSGSSLENAVPFFDQEVVSFYGRYKNSKRTIPRKFACQSPDLKKRAQLCHQATFIHRNVYRETGGYNESFRSRMDYELFLKIVQKWPVKCVSDILIEYSPSGISGSFRYAWDFIAEGVNAENLATGKNHPDYMKKIVRYIIHCSRLLIRKTILFRA